MNWEKHAGNPVTEAGPEALCHQPVLDLINQPAQGEPFHQSGSKTQENYAQLPNQCEPYAEWVNVLRLELVDVFQKVAKQGFTLFARKQIRNDADEFDCARARSPIKPYCLIKLVGEVCAY